MLPPNPKPTRNPQHQTLHLHEGPSHGAHIGGVHHLRPFPRPGFDAGRARVFFPRRQRETTDTLQVVVCVCEVSVSVVPGVGSKSATCLRVVVEVKVVYRVCCVHTLKVEIMDNVCMRGDPHSELLLWAN